MSLARETSQYVRQLETEGWTADLTAKGHYRLRHPEAERQVFTGSTPGDHRSLLNLKAEIKRALPPPPQETVENKPRPVRTPGRRPSPPRPVMEAMPPPSTAPRRTFITHTSLTIDPHILRRAYALMLVRLRLRGMDAATARIMGRRFRKDEAFRKATVAAYLSAPRGTLWNAHRQLLARWRTPVPVVVEAVPQPVVEGEQPAVAEADMARCLAGVRVR